MRTAWCIRGFVKTLTNLSDLGPEDGGTVVIAGSHKMKCPRDEVVACAYEDPSLIHHVVAPAGSTLLFTEALVHATGQRRSDGERAIMIAGYTPTHFQAWAENQPGAAFVERAPERLRPLLSGSDRWRREYRLQAARRQARALAVVVAAGPDHAERRSRAVSASSTVSLSASTATL